MHLVKENSPQAYIGTIERQANLKLILIATTYLVHPDFSVFPSLPCPMSLPGITSHISYFHSEVGLRIGTIPILGQMGGQVLFQVRGPAGTYLRQRV